MKNSAIILILLLLMVAGGIWLQIFLSKKNNKWFGLVLPIISFGYSLLMVFNIAVYNGMTSREVFWLIAATLFLSNIPTLILMVIYFACREKMKRKSELAKMNVQDLE